MADNFLESHYDRVFGGSTDPETGWCSTSATAEARKRAERAYREGKKRKITDTGK